MATLTFRWKGDTLNQQPWSEQFMDAGEGTFAGPPQYSLPAHTGPPQSELGILIIFIYYHHSF